MMKKIYLAALFSVLGISSLCAQDISEKYGKITDYELKMTSYDADTSAVAVVIYDSGDTYYDFISNDFRVNTQYSKKVKILKPEGVDHATVSIPYYKQSSDREQIVKLEAYAYNLENGQIVKSKLEKKYIFEEEVSPNLSVIKFSIPGVKAGTVIEYRYEKTSPFYYEIPDWKIQGELPVMKSSYRATLPEYFIFSLSVTGYEHVGVKETKGNQTFRFVLPGGKSEGLDCTTRIIDFTATNVPALDDEAYVWCAEDFMSGVKFELNATRFPYSAYKPYTLTWGDVEKTLNKNTEFTGSMKGANPYRDEMKPVISLIKDDEAKILAVYSFVKSKIRWNGKYAFTNNNPRDAVKNGTGNNAQINSVLLRALKEAGIVCYPVMMSRRSQGRIPMARPSLNALNTYIVAAETSDGDVFYMDGSAVYGGPNVLPIDLLVDRAWIFHADRSERWVDLTDIVPNESIRSFVSDLHDDGTMKTEMTGTYTNQYAYSFRSTHAAAKDSTDFAEKYQADENIIVDSIGFTGLEPFSKVAGEKLIFTKKFDTEVDYLYINPLIFEHITKNPFIRSERKLPIEFNFPSSYQIRSTITIPQGYKVEEVPSAAKTALKGNAGQLDYLVRQNGNTIEVEYKFELNQTIFPFTDYGALRDFFGLAAQKNSELIVLKKL